MRLIALSISALLLVAAACSDDTQPTKQDQKITTADLAFREAQPPKTDGTPAVDGKLPGTDGTGAKLGCGEATTDAQVCAKACPAGAALLACMIKCNDDGKAKGCESAKPLFDALTTCISTTCIADCLTGPTPACVTCTKDKCKTPYDACYAHKC